MKHGTVSLTPAFALCVAVMLLSVSTPARAQSTAFSARNVPDFTVPIVADSDAGGLESPELDAAAPASDDLPDAPQTPQASTPMQSTTTPAPPGTTINNGEQTKRILFIVPNFRAASVDAKLPPMTAKEEIKLVLQDSFDYSSFIYVGIVAGISFGQNSYPEFHQGAAGYGRYYWHSLADAVGENAFTEFLIPYPTREDPRYYTLGRGGIPKRLVYSVSRLAITRDNNANNTVNFAEIVGAGASAGVSTLYYPSAYATWTKTGQKWLVQLAVDGLSNVAKEFWPDVNAGLFKNRF
jgi:hypothetical protein